MWKHYLQDEPVHACPPSSVYRFRKFASRNRTVLFTVAVVMVALTLGVAASSWQAIRAVSAEQQAKANEQLAIANSKQTEEVSKFLVSALRSPDPNRDGKKITVAELLDRSAKELQDKFADDARTKAVLLQAIADTYRGLGLDREAIPLLEQVRDLRVRSLGPDHGDTISAMSELQVAYCVTGRHSESLRLAEEILKLQTTKLGPDHLDTLRSMRQLGVALALANRNADATQITEKTLALLKAKVGPDDRRVLKTMGDLGSQYGMAGRDDEAISLLEELCPIAKAKLGPDHETTLLAMHNLAASYWRVGRPSDALRLQEEVVRLSKVKYGLDDNETLIQERNLAILYHDLGRIDEAVTLIDETIRQQKLKFRSDDPAILTSLKYRARMLLIQAKFLEAETTVREILLLAPKDFEYHLRLGETLERQSKYFEAATAYRDAIQLNSTDPLGHRELASVMLAQSEAVGETPPWDEIASEFVKAIDLSEGKPFHGYRQTVCSELAQWDEVFNRVAQIRPDEPALWIGRGEDRALRSRWSDALAEYAKAILQRPSAGDENTEYAYLLVLLNDMKGFQQFCHEFIARPGEPHDAATCFQMARAMAAAPFDTIDPNRLVEWATLAMTKEPDRKRDGAWLHCLGLAQYRGGNSRLLLIFSKNRTTPVGSKLRNLKTG